MDLEIKPLTPDLAADYFDFFDKRAFTDNEEFSCCYCTWFHMNSESDKQVREEVKADGGEDALRRALRGRSESMVREETLQGYLAYVDGIPIGWCNANDKKQFKRFYYEEGTSRFISNNTVDKVKAATCFVIAPEYRRKGVAAALLEHVVQDARGQGYDAVEGYPRLQEQSDAYNYPGPLRLFEKCGFIKVAEHGDVAIMRKELK
jgi:GNAT superfamily N-acetyltransferase